MSEYVIDDRTVPRFRVNRKALVDQEVLELEKSKIFDKSWLYVGHDSEVANPRDFRARNVGGRPVIFVRSDDGRVRVFMNTCPHRGTTLCQEPSGSARFLKCYYHAWTFDNAGRLVSLPDEESYGPTFDRENLGLAPAPRLEQYAGFWFLSFDPDIVDLRTYLAGAGEYLDLVADQGASGMTVVPGSQDYSTAANWKLLVENSMDGYHGAPLHQRYFEMVIDAGATFNVTKSRGLDLGNGHAVVITNGELGRPAPPELAPLVDAKRGELVARVGEERAAKMHGTRNLVIFPNFALVDLVGAITIRTFFPVRPDYMEVTAWELAPADEDPRLRRTRADSFNTFWGPAGLATPDDIEALQACQRGFAAHREAVWSDISRGLGTESPTANDEIQMRCFWRRWNELLTGERPIPEPQAPLEPFAASVAAG